MPDNLPARLLGNKILVEPVIPVMNTTSGGIIIPVSVKNQLEQATVIMYAPDVINLKKGDIVLYPSGGGILQEYQGKNFKFISGPTATNEGDIWAVL